MSLIFKTLVVHEQNTYNRQNVPDIKHIEIKHRSAEILALSIYFPVSLCEEQNCSDEVAYCEHYEKHPELAVLIHEILKISFQCPQ